jgi:hypothetical protein
MNSTNGNCGTKSSSAGHSIFMERCSGCALMVPESAGICESCYYGGNTGAGVGEDYPGVSCEGYDD